MQILLVQVFKAQNLSCASFSASSEQELKTVVKSSSSTIGFPFETKHHLETWKTDIFAQLCSVCGGCERFVVYG